MNKPIYDFFTNDHHRIEQMLVDATKDIHNIDMDLYEEFRKNLLKHIKMEEKHLFVYAQKANGGEQFPHQAQLRLEHGALTTLVVPPPTPEIIMAIKNLLLLHDEVEEAPGGTYDICEKLTGEETEKLLAEVKAVTEVPLHPHNPADYALQAAIRCVERAGYVWEKITKENFED